MKQQIQKARLRKGVAVGTAMVLGASVGDSAGRAARLRAVEASATDSASLVRSFQPAGEMAGVEQSTVTISVPPEPSKWVKADARRFRELAVKRATKVASPDEQKEFIILQQRRRLHYLASGDEVMSEWQRRRFVSEILGVLNRNVRFFKAEDKARLRSLRQA